MDKQPEITPTAIRQVLGHWDVVADMGRHPLARLKIVQQRCQQAHHPESTVGYGLALKELLHEAIQLLRPNQGEPDPAEKAWRPFLIIRQRYCLGRIPEWVMLELSVSSRTLYRELRLGLQQMVEQFNHWEAEALQNDPPESLPKSHLLPRPNRPLHRLINRDPLRQTIRSWLADPETQTIALYGLPGVGKTTFALTLVDDPAVEQLFTNGMMWIGVGREPNMRRILGQIGRQSGLSEVEINQYDSTSDLTAAVSHQMRRQKWLLIFDDVWQTDHALQLSVGGPGSVHLLTTRQQRVAAAFAGSYAADVPEFDRAQSRVLLNQLAPQIPLDMLDQLIQLTGGLPLALCILGKYVHQQGYGGQQRRLQQAFDTIRNPVGRITLPLESSRVVQPNLFSEESISLANVIGLSVNTLHPDALEMACALVLFPAKPNTFTLTAALAVSKGKDDAFYQLVDSGLVEPVGEDRYAIHQVVHDVIHARQKSDAHRQSYVAYHTILCERQGYGQYTMIEVEQTNIEQALPYGTPDMIDWLARLLFVYSRFLIDRGRAAEAGKIIEEWMNQDDLSIQARARLVVCRGRVEQAQSQSEEALASYRLGYRLAAEADLPDVALRTSVLAMRMHLRRGDHRAAQAIAAEIHHKIEDVSDPPWRASAHLALSAVSFYLSDYAAALHHGHQARRLFAQLPDKTRLASVYQNLGAFSVELARYDEAFVYYDLALEKYRQAHNRYRQAQIHINLGVVSLDVGRWRHAHQHYQAALEIQEKIQNKDILEQTLLNLAVLYAAQADLEAAQSCLDQGLKISREGNYLFRRGKFLVTQSVVYGRGREIERAVGTAQEALAVAKQLENPQLTGEAALQLGIALTLAETFTSAVDQLLAAVNIFQEQNQPQGVVEAQVYLAWGYHQLGHDRQARQTVFLAADQLAKGVDGIHDAAELLLLCRRLFADFGEDELADQFDRKARTYIEQQLQQFDSLEGRVGYAAYHGYQRRDRRLETR